MKNTLVPGIAAIVLATAGTAMAAGPGPDVNVPLFPSYDWSGPYIGVNGGYGWGNAKYNFAPGGSGDGYRLFAPDTTGGSFSQSPSGGLVGGQFGFNQQWGHLVLGLETSFDWSGIGASSSNQFSPTENGASYETNLRWLIAVTPRVGYAWNNLLGYVKGGLAIGQVQSSLGARNLLNQSQSYSDTHTALGWTVGAGVNVAAWQNWVVGLEYDYYDLGTQRFGGQATPNAADWPVDYSVRTNYSVVLAKVSYQFGGTGGSTTPADPFIGFSGPWNAPTDWTGFYIGVNGGYGFGSAKDSFAPGGSGDGFGLYAPNTTGGPAGQDLSGGLAGGQLGFNKQWSNVVLGLETTLDWSGMDGTSTNQLPGTGPGVSYTNKVRWLATITPRVGYAVDNLLFYAKAGVAAADMLTETHAPTSFLGVPTNFSQTRDFLGWTVGFGAETALWQNVIVGIEYNAYGFSSQHVGGETQPNTTFPVDYNVRPSFGTVLARISYKFGSVTPPSPAPAPVAAPAPAPARSYLVFFDWDKATLTSRAQQIIKEAADNSTHVQYTRIEVNGYTDTSGTPQYNQGLSVRRAQAVAAELVKDGVPRNAIAIQGFGETHLLVPTGAGVREPQNRRVEIIIR